MQQLESDLDVTQEKLLNANQKLEEKEKALLNAEGEVAAPTGASRCSRRTLRSPRRGSSSPHRSSTRLQPPLTTTSVCARCWRTRACPTSPAWRPLRTS